MPKNPNDYELYKNTYYLPREKSAEGKNKRVARQRARREAISDGRLSGKDDPREVDHKTPLSKGGGSDKSNTRITSQTANRRKYDH